MEFVEFTPKHQEQLITGACFRLAAGSLTSLSFKARDYLATTSLGDRDGCSLCCWCSDFVSDSHSSDASLIAGQSTTSMSC